MVARSLAPPFSSSCRQRLAVSRPSTSSLSPPCMRIGSARTFATRSRLVLAPRPSTSSSTSLLPVHPSAPRIIGLSASGYYPTIASSCRRLAHSSSRSISSSPARKCDDSPAAMSAAVANYTGKAKLIDGTAIAKYVARVCRCTNNSEASVRTLPSRSTPSRQRKSPSRPPCWPSSSSDQTLRPRRTSA